MTGKIGYVDGEVTQATQYETPKKKRIQQKSEINLFKPHGAYPYFQGKVRNL